MDFNNRIRNGATYGEMGYTPSGPGPTVRKPSGPGLGFTYQTAYTQVNVPLHPMPSVPPEQAKYENSPTRIQRALVCVKCGHANVHDLKYCSEYNADPTLREFMQRSCHECGYSTRVPCADAESDEQTVTIKMKR